MTKNHTCTFKVSKFRSLATKLTVFTAVLIVWMEITEVLSRQTIGRTLRTFEHWVLCFLLLIPAILVARFTSRLFVKPLVVLQKAIAKVSEGHLEEIRVSPTRDEIELLGHSFNKMTASLASSQREIRSYQEGLEARIRQRTKALHDAKHKAETANRAKTEFLANMSHELRTPLSGVIGMIDMVLDSHTTPRQTEELETAKGCARSLLALLNDILDLSKIEAGKMSLEKIPVEIRPLASECLAGFRPLAEGKGIRLHSEIDPEVPEAFLGDPLRMRQVASNLLSNAIKFTDQGSVELRLKRLASAGNQIELQLEVSDTGVGIPPEKLSEIFEKFTQADGTTSRKYGGTGLGLAITLKLVQMHGGRIWVESELGRGSTFYVTWEVEACPVPKRNEALSEGSWSKRSRAKPNRVLVVEDNLVNQKVLAAMLNKQGYETVLASHGQQALDLLDKSAFDLVLLDLQMPVLDGMQTIQRIRQDERWKSLPVVAVTAHVTGGDRQRCLDAGMDDYLAKPVRPAELLAVVGHHLNVRGSRPKDPLRPA